MAAPFTPEVFGDFLLVQRLARSAMAEALVAVRLGDRSGRTFVVKRPVLGERASGRAAQAIAREAEVLEAVRGPALPALEAAGEIAGLPYVAMEHVRGVALDALLAHAAPLSPGAAAAVAKDVAGALATLHAAGWVHGDVTPSNVIVDDAGEARLLDLGLSRRAGERRTEVAGKPGYVAPEAALPGDASPAEDVYSFGVVAAECALGRRLFEERDLVEAAARADAPKELSALEEALPGVAAALARRPEARPTVEALLRRLDALPVDRGALAELVDRSAKTPPALEQAVAAAAPRAAVTSAAAAAPAASAAMVVVRAPAAQVAPSSSAPAPAYALIHAAAPHARSGARAAWATALVLAGLLLLIAGGILGRVTGRNRAALFSIAGSIPRRTHLELDRKPFAYPAGGAVPVPPGAHTLAIVLPKGSRREYTFQVRPGEHVILTLATPVRRANGRPEPEEETP